MQIQEQIVKTTPTNPHRFMRDPGIMLVFILTAIGIGGFLIWASTVKIAQGITATGQLSIENRRKTIQHLEGGIIEEILIQDRDNVEAGQLLLVLSNVEANAIYEQLMNIIVAKEFEQQRIETQLRGNERFLPSTPRYLKDAPTTLLNISKEVQIGIFNDMQEALNGGKTVLEARINRYQTEIDGAEAQLSTLASTIRLEQSEIDRLTPIVSDKLASAAELTNARRRLNSALSERSNLRAKIESSRASIIESEEEIRQTGRQFIADIAPQLSAVRKEKSEAQEQLQANQDVLHRRQILAPISGQILNLNYTTIGGVIAPGETIMDIVPQDEELYIQAQILPIDIDNVLTGMKVNVRFSTLDPVDPPEIVSTIGIVDQDVTTIPDTGEQFFIARVDLPEDDPEVITLKESGDFIAGVPVEIFADMGKDRTPLSYIVQPLSDIMEKGLRGE